MPILYPEHITLRNKPKNLAPNDLLLFEQDYAKKIDTFGLDIITNADILGDTVFSRSRLKFYSNHTHLIRLSVLNRLKKLSLFFAPRQKLDKGIWIIDNWSHGYFHWLTDALSRLIASEDFMEGHTVVLPGYYEKIPFIRQSLELLHFQVKFYDTPKRVVVKSLLLPGHTAPTGHYNKEIINKVRDRFSVNGAKTGNRKIYISREKATKRKIVNEKEVIELMKSYGFEIHFFEDYDFHEQVNLMQQTSVVTGLHGAGLTNMLFMPAGGKVLEFRNAGDTHHNCYFSLASDLAHDYYYLLNESDTHKTHFANIKVDIAKLKAVVEQIF